MSNSSPLSYNRQNATATGIALDNASNIAGKIVITTGVSPNGAGAYFVQTIAKHNPKLLILAGRNPSKVEATASKIASINPSVSTRILQLDLSSLASVRKAAAEVNAWSDVPNVDVLVNSAGVMAGPWEETEDGFEKHFAANHLGHFLFTNLIMTKILKSEKPRVVNISSDGHRASAIRFDDPFFQNGKVYNQWLAYGQSKSANILFSKALAEKVGPRGLRAYSLHPGVMFGSSLMGGELGDADWADLRRIDKEIGDRMGEPDADWDIKDEEGMTSTYVVAAFDPRLEDFNGAYLEDANLSDNQRPTVTKVGDPAKLWDLSERLVGEKFSY